METTAFGAGAGVGADGHSVEKRNACSMNV